MKSHPHIPIHIFSLLIQPSSVLPGLLQQLLSGFVHILYLSTHFSKFYRCDSQPSEPFRKKHADGSHLPMDKGPASENRTGNPWLRDPASHTRLILCCPSPGSLPSSSKGSTITSEVEMLTHIFKILCIRFQLL